MSDWSIGEAAPLEAARCSYTSPRDVFEHDYDRLVRALTLVAGSRDVAADAVQEAFVRLINRWDTIGAYDDPVGWVRRVALNQIRDRQRAFVRQARLLVKMEEESQPPEGALEPDREIWRHVRRLSPRQRAVVALVYVADLTARETAEVMHISEGAVEKHLHRARTKLKDVLKEARDE